MDQDTGCRHRFDEIVTPGIGMHDDVVTPPRKPGGDCRHLAFGATKRQASDQEGDAHSSSDRRSGTDVIAAANAIAVSKVYSSKML